MQKRDEGGDAGCDAMKEVTLGATAEVRGVDLTSTLFTRVSVTTTSYSV
jgi:hypothetical protein